jgi:hypothetical protein
MSTVTQLGSTQTSIKNLFLGEEIFYVALVGTPYIGSLRITISGLAGTTPVNWTLTVLQNGYPEVWNGQTAASTVVSLVIENILVMGDNSSLSITLENDEEDDVYCDVNAKMFVQTTPLTASGTREAVGLATANLDAQLGDIPSADENADAVRTELSTELVRLDTTVSSRLGSLGATAPAGWINTAAITDNAYETIAAYTSDKVSNEWSINAGQWNTVNYVIREAVWNRTVRTLSDFSFSVTVGTNNDKTGYTLIPTTGLGNQTANITGNLTGSIGSVTDPVTVGTNNDKTGYALTPTTGLGNQTADITGNLSGSVGSVTGAVGSVTGAVGSVTGNVGGNVVGSVASVVGAVGSVTGAVTVGTNNDKTGYSLSQSFPANFAAMGINASGHVERVTLVDTTTTNTDMRGTDNAALAADYNATRAGYLDKLNVSGTLAHSDAAATYKADVSGLSTFNPASDQVIVATNNDKTGYALTQAFPSNFAALDINSSGHVSRVVLVDTTTTNSDMRGTDSALLASSYTAPANADIAAIKAKTDNLPTDPADQSAVELAITAATSPLATSANLATVAGYLDTEIAEILADTSELQTDWANGGRLDAILDARASQASVDVVDGIVDEILVDTGTTLPAAIAAIELSPDITVNPTELSSGSVDAIRDGLATDQDVIDAKDEIVEAIVDIPESIINSQRLVDEIVFFSSAGAMTIDSLSGSLATVNRLNDCLMRITDSSGNIQLRWIRSHFHSSGRAGFNPDLDFNPTPSVGDRVEIFNIYRGASNVVNWRGDVPSTLTSGRVNSLVGAMSNNVITTSSINDGAFTEPKFSTGFFSAIWNVATRTLTSISDSSGITTLLERITGLIRTKSEDDIADQEILEDIWTYDTRTLTSDNNLTAQEVWEYSTRTITNDVEVEVDFTDILESLSQINTKISSTVVNIISPLSSDGTSLTIIQGDDYLVGDGRNILFTGDIENQWVDLTDSTVVFGISDTSTLKEVSVVTPVGTQQLSLELTKENTSIPQGSYKYDVQATLSNGSVVTLFRGNLEIIKSYT